MLEGEKLRPAPLEHGATSMRRELVSARAHELNAVEALPSAAADLDDIGIPRADRRRSSAWLRVSACRKVLLSPSLAPWPPYSRVRKRRPRSRPRFEDPTVVKGILTHLGLPAEPLPASNAQAPPTTVEMFEDP